MNLKQTKWIIALGFIALGILIVSVSLLPKSTQYYVTVDEFLGDPEKFGHQELKVAGKVIEGTIRKDDKESLWEFTIENQQRTLEVVYKGAMPDTFKDTADVVVTGRLADNGRFEANHVLAKCASRYEEKLVPGYQSKPRS
mgnify:CR=1 FL=1